LKRLAKLTFPERSRGDWLVAILVFCVSALHFSFFYRSTLLIGDEGIVLQGAQRILAGQVLYRDFFSFLTPGSYYWVALFFKLFGSSILVARAVLLVEGALLSTVTYLLARRVCARWSALLASLCLTLTGLPYWFLVSHNWDSSLWACLALYCAVLSLEVPRYGTLFAVGWFSALTCLFEQSKGAGLVVGLGLAFVILAITDRETPPHWKPGVWGLLALGFGLPFLVTFLYFAINHSLFTMLDAWLWPLDNYSAINKTPYGFVGSREAIAAVYTGPWPSRVIAIIVTAPWFFMPSLPLIAIGVLLYVIPKKRQGRLDWKGRAYYVVISTVVIGLIASAVTTGRPDFTHLMYLSPVVFVTLSWIIDGHLLPSRFVRLALPFLVFALLLSCLAFGTVLLLKPLNASASLHTRRGALKAGGSDEVIDYIQAKFSPGQTILVYPDQPLYYYLTATFGPARYEHLIPGFHTADQFRDFATELEAAKTPMVLFEPSYRQGLSPGLKISSETLAEPDPVAGYIGSNYRICANLESQDGRRFVAMIRKDLPCP